MRYKMVSISQWLSLPSVCVLCNQYHQGTVAVCEACQMLFTPLGQVCCHCAMPLPPSDFLVCGQCSKKKPYYDSTIAALRFEEPIRTLLHEFKYQEGLYLADFFAALIAKALSKDALETQCLIPVPMHPKRLRQRGFNQAAELVKKLGKRLKLHYDLSHCKKIINTAPQASLNREQRQKNLHNAFQAEPLLYQHVTLVDDLLTTGSTANALAKLLKEQGVTRVDVWCCARVLS